MNKLKLLLTALLLLGARSGADAQIAYTCEYNSATNECSLVQAAGTPTDGNVAIPTTFTNPADNKQYKLVEIKAGAMNGILGMRQLTIPSSVHTIGNVSSTRNQSAKVADLDNFLWCPDLEKITVESGNPTFKATAAGVLTSYDANNVYRVPPRFYPENGVYKMSTLGIRIARHAFNQCSLISKIVFSNGLDYVDPQSDMWTMKYLAEFEIPTGSTGARNFMLDGRALVEKASKTLVAVPPAGTEGEVYVVNASNVTAIGAYAFAKTAFSRVTIPSGVKSIGERAFFKSSIASMTVPESVNAADGLGVGCFEASALESITTKTTADLRIPEACFRGCEKLTSVQFAKAPAQIGQAAFRNCSSLSQYPYFTGRTELEGDSIWAGSGLQLVIYSTSNLRGAGPSGVKATFHGCTRLEEIEMREIAGFTFESPFVCAKDFATGCTVLKKISMPSYTHFAPGAFSINNNLNTLVVGNFTYEESGIFRFNSSSTMAPTTYVYTPDDSYVRFVTPVEGLYKNLGTGELHGEYFMAPTLPGIQTLVAGGKFYVPGGALENYPTGDIKAMYDFWVTGTGSQTELNFADPYSRLKFVAVELRDAMSNYRREIVAAGGDKLIVGMNFHALTYVTVEYLVNGVLMRSTYPKSLLPLNPQSGIDGVEAPEAGITLRNGMIEVPEGAECAVYDLTGRKVSEGSDISSLRGGIYIVRAVCGDRSMSLKFAK